jgi:hypothetical protein
LRSCDAVPCPHCFGEPVRCRQPGVVRAPAPGAVDEPCRATAPVVRRHDGPMPPPATVDLLGFETVVSAIEGALSTDHLDPLTTGVHSPWGGGQDHGLEDDRGCLEELASLVPGEGQDAIAGAR